MRLENTVTLVNGAGSGLGAETAKTFAREGSKVVVSDINLEAAQTVAGEIARAGGEALAVRLDVADAAETDAAVEACLARFGRLDHLVHCAGIFSDAAFLDMTEEMWDQTIAINLKGSFLAAQRAARVMVKQKYGRIILFGSIAGQRGASPTHAHYGASKAGVFAFAQTAAEELALHNVTVNCIAPGIVATPLNAKMRGQQSEAMVAGIYMKRFGQAADVANACLFLALGESGYITGTTIDVNGGMVGRL